MLEIGSIVYLKGGGKKLMVLNRGSLMENENVQLMYDYSACIYPLGLVPEKTFYFNEENIDRIIFRGFHDGEEDRFREIYGQWLGKYEGKKGKV